MVDIVRRNDFAAGQLVDLERIGAERLIRENLLPDLSPARRIIERIAATSSMRRSVNLAIESLRFLHFPISSLRASSHDRWTSCQLLSQIFDDRLCEIFLAHDETFVSVQVFVSVTDLAGGFSSSFAIRAFKYAQ